MTKGQSSASLATGKNYKPSLLRFVYIARVGGPIGIHHYRLRLLYRTTSRTIRDIGAREFERPPAVAATAGIEFRSMVGEGEQVPLKKLIEAGGRQGGMGSIRRRSCATK